MITETKAWRVEGLLFDTQEEAEQAEKQKQQFEAITTSLGITNPAQQNIAQAFLAFLNSTQKRENMKKALDKLDKIDGIRGNIITDLPI